MKTFYCLNEDKEVIGKVTTEHISDGYHTMHELYEHRMALNVALFNVINELQEYGEDNLPDLKVMKSKLHYDGTMFEGGYFVVVLFDTARNNQISYHYKLKHWDKFTIPEVERIPFPYDGHTSKDVLEALLKL